MARVIIHPAVLALTVSLIYQANGAPAINYVKMGHIKHHYIADKDIYIQDDRGESSEPGGRSTSRLKTPAWDSSVGERLIRQET